MASREARGEGDAVHVPVLVEPILELLGGEASPLAPCAGETWVVDATLGAGGHAERILAAFPHVRLFGLDQDPEVLALATRRLAPFGERARLARGRFSDLGELLAAGSVQRPAAILADLGASSLQLDRPERGFSFLADGPLDMRMDPGRRRTAADIVNTWDAEDLADLFYHEGGETRSRRIARAIVEARRQVPFLRTGGLAEVVAAALGGRSARSGRSRGPGKLHPATRTFQALRRAVNEEGEELLALCAGAEELLRDGGILLTISFHSGEDGQMKRFFAEGARAGRWTQLTKKPIGPDPEERQANRRSRSAKLRAAARRRLVDEPRRGERSWKEERR